MADWIDKLSEIRHLKEAGAINEAEFERRRAEAIAERDDTRTPRLSASQGIESSQYTSHQMLGSDLDRDPTAHLKPQTFDPKSPEAPLSVDPPTKDAPRSSETPPPPLPPSIGLSYPPPPSETHAAGIGASLVSRLGQRSVIVPAAIIAAVILIGVGFFLFGGDLFTPTVKTYATRDAEVMSAIDPKTATMLGAVHRGDAVSGHWIKGRDGKPQWLRIRWAGHGDGFVWARDLSMLPRPVLTASDQPSQTASMAALVYSEPDKASAVVDDLSQGESAATVGATADGWTELALASGGVGYVQAATFLPGSSTAGAAVSPALANISHYRCAFAPDQSVDAPPDTPNLDFYFDENRLCVNHTFAYLRDTDGGLRRVMLNDQSRRVSLLQFAGDRHAFYRTDYTLPADTYSRLSRTSAALKSIVCPPPGDTAALATVRGTLASATPDLTAQTASGSWKRRVWLCTAD